MGAIFGFIVGLAVGWFACFYKEKLTRIKSKVETAVKEEMK